MKTIGLVSIIAFLAVVATAQPNPDTLWTRTYGGSGDDVAYSIQQTTDGGYIIAGYTQSFGAGGTDFYLVKTNDLGDTLWTRTYGGIEDDEAYSIQQTIDGGYIIAGETWSFGAGECDFYLVKTDSHGDTIWTRTFGGSWRDEAYSVQQTSDGGYIIAGGTDFYLVKTNDLGDTLWTRTYGGDWGTKAFSVQQIAEGGYIVVGYRSHSDFGRKFYLVKTDSQGDTLWTRTYAWSGMDMAYSVQQTSDGGYIVAGLTYDWGESSAFYVVKTNSQGDSLWTRTYGRSAYACAFSVQQTTDGGYIVAGTIVFCYGGLDDIYIVKTNSQGDTLWTRTYGGSERDKGCSVQQTSDGGYIIAGCTESFGAGAADFYLVKTGPDISPIESPTNILPSKYALHPNFPNPFNPVTTISYDVKQTSVVQLTIFNLLGQRVATLENRQYSPGSYTVMWNAVGFPSGIYLCQMEAGAFSQARKLLLVK